MNLVITSILSLICSLFIFSTPVQAKVIMQEKGTVTIPAGEVLDDDLFVGAENFELYGTVTGDVFVGAGSVKVFGTIKGGLFAGTGDLTVTGANIADSLVVGAGSVTLDSASKIGGSLIVGTGNLSNSATIGRNLMVGAGTIYQDGKVGKEARLGASTITLGGDTAIAGNLNYALGEDGDQLSQDPSATIAGAVSRYTPPAEVKQDMVRAREDMAKFGLVASRGWLIVSFIGSLLLGFLLLKIFPKTSLGLSTQIKSDLLRSLGVGFLIIVFALPVVLVLSLTVIGLPLAGILILTLLISLHLAKLVTSYALGRFIATQFNWNKLGVYATIFIGLAVFYLLRSSPPFGWAVSLIFSWTGLGAIWLYTKSHQKNL